MKSVLWTARVVGTLIGLLMLMEFVEGIGYLGQLDAAGIALRIGFFLVFAGCVAGWFKALPAWVLILGGTVVIAAAAGRAMGRALPILIFPLIVGLLYLYAFMAGKRRRE